VTTGKMITLVGIVIVLIGLAVSYAPWLVNWFGRLPGDIRIQNEKSFVFIPIVSMLIVSIILSLIINLFFRK
jgi:glycerol uptake facilitator-like aquaporin